MVINDNCFKDILSNILFKNGEHRYNIIYPEQKS